MKCRCKHTSIVLIAPFYTRINQDLPEEEIDERDKHAKLIGQLK